MAKSKKTRTGKTHIALLLDQSGSMQSVKDDTIGAYNAYLESQRESTADEALWSLTLFEGNNIEQRHTAVPLADVPEMTYKTFVPMGGTPLYDAIGKTVKALEPSVGPDDRVLFVVLTDGEENASQEYTHEAVKALIAEVEGRGNWNVIYLGATPNAVAIGTSLGTRVGNSAAFDQRNIGATMSVMAMNTVAYRSGPSAQGVNMTEGIEQEKGAPPPLPWTARAKKGK